MKYEEKESIEEKERFRVTEKDQEHEFGKEKFKAVSFDIFAFVRSVLLAVIMGLAIGAYSTLFALLIDWISGFRNEHMWLLFLLPLGGVMIVAFYHLLNTHNSKGTNRVLESISSNEELPLKMTPLITVATVITHLVGGSAGREGAALQIGGSLGNWFGGVLNLDKRQKTILTLCGMSAAFSAMFGTPLTAVIFAIEVVSIGIIHYSALVPCVVSSLTAGWIAKIIGYTPPGYPKVSFPSFTWVFGLKALAFGILCAIVSVAFCILMHKSENFFKKYISNSYLRAITGGLLIIVFTIITGTSDYNGAGTGVILTALNGNTIWYAFIIKMILTAITLSTCFKGGEIIPTLFIGATFGCFFGPLIGIPEAVGAVLGIAGVFCGVTNCPLASIALCIELFGIGGLPMILIVIAVSYRLSGYYGIYTGQKIIYSKSRPLFINRTTWK